MIKRALISVSDKTGIVECARRLQQLDIEILSTGGTAKLLAANGISVIEVSDHTGFPEMMDGRLKTLHPRIHGGLLGRRGIDDGVMAQSGILLIDLLIVNLYPFESTIASPACTFAEAIENIDIGGPAMLRAAAKNFAAVTVLVDTGDYARVADEIAAHGGVNDDLRYSLAVKAFEYTARYDATIANYLGALNGAGLRDVQFPNTYSMQLRKAQELRYGENPHQRAAFYVEHQPPAACVSTASQLQGKELSFNNIADADTALECVKSFTEASACVIVKHANPCGVALGKTPREAYQRAHSADPTSAFGGIIAFNEAVDAASAQAIIERQFVEVIIAPAYSEEALALLRTKPNVRVLACDPWSTARVASLDYKRVNGGLLMQDQDLGIIHPQDFKIVTEQAPTPTQMQDLLFAWKVARFVKSNAIVYCRDAMTTGIGAGQMSRVYSARIAAIKAADAGLTISGSVLASDAFFPFRDGLDAAAEAGVSAVIQPGGSVRDPEVIAAANEHGIAMVFTGMRHFRH